MELNEKHLKKHFEQLVQCTNLQKVNEILNQYLTQNGNVSIMDYLQTLISDDTSNDKIIISLAKNEIEKSIQLLSTLTQSTLNKLNMSGDSFRKEVDEIVDLNQENSELEQFLINVVKLTKRNKQLIRVASNFLHLLVRMNIQLFYEDFSYIEIEDTNISQGNLAGCNLDYSKFTNVNISGVNLNGASLKNAKWLNLKTFEQNIIKEKNSIDKVGLISHSNVVVTFCQTQNSITTFNFLSRRLIYSINLKQKIYQFALSNKGVIAIGTELITFVNANTGKLMCQYAKLHDEDSYTQLEFSFDGSLLASFNFTNKVQIWKVESKELVTTFCDNSIYLFKFHTSLNQIALYTGYRNGSKIQIYEIEKQNLIHQISGIYDDVYDICLTIDYIIIGTCSSIIQIWDKDGKEYGCLDYHIDKVVTIAYQDKLQIMATGSSDNTVILWDVANRKKISMLRGHTKSILQIQFTSDGQYLISSSKDKTIRVWNIETVIKSNLQQKQLQNFSNFQISNDEKQLFFLSNCLKIYDIQDRHFRISMESIQQLQQQQYLNLFRNIYKCFTLSRKVVLIYFNRQQMKTYLLNSQQNIYKNDQCIDINQIIQNSKVLQQISQILWIDSIKSSNKNKIYITVQHGLLKFWQKNKVIFKIHQNAQITVFEVSLSGNLLLTQSCLLSIQIWELNKRLLIQQFKGHKSTICCAQFTPNEKIVVTSSQDQQMIFWNVATGAQIRSIVSDYGYIYSMKIVNQNEHCKECNLFTNSQAYFQVWNLGDCNVNQFKPICYKQYSRQNNPINIDNAILTESHLTNSQNYNLLSVFEIIKQQYY